MFRPFLFMLAMLLANPVFSASLTFSLDGSATHGNTTVSSFSVSDNVTASAGSFSEFVSGRISTVFQNNRSFFSSGTYAIGTTVSYLGETVTQSVSYNISTYNNNASPGAIGATGNVSINGPVDFDFSGATFTLTGFSGSTNCLGCSIGQTRTGTIFVSGTLAEVAPVPLPAGGLLLISAVGFLAGRRWLKKT